MFKDRKEAGERLAEELARYNDLDMVLLAIPRGGVPVAYESVRRHGIPMDVIIIKKIGHPNNPEYAVGAVSLNSSFIHPVHSARALFNMRTNGAWWLSYTYSLRERVPHLSSLSDRSAAPHRASWTTQRRNHTPQDFPRTC